MPPEMAPARTLACAGAALALAMALGAPGMSAAEPLPRPRPAAPDASPAAPESQALLPNPRPRNSEVGLPRANRIEEPDPLPEPARVDPAPAAIDAGEERACRQRLEALGVAFEPMEPIDGDGACGAAAPLEITALAPGVSLTPAAILNCRTAEALAKWVREEVVPAAERHLGAEPTGLLHASSYVCRTRNNRPGGKLSEHATANAIDIAGIDFDERNAVAVVARGDDEAAERAFQRAVRKGACKHFTTVLGPGTNAAHATHFHFDLAQRRGGYRLCE